MPTKIILDTDIGDDIDDAFALALAASSPELKLLGVTTVHGPTEKRARIARKLLNEAGASDVPVIPGFHGCGSEDHEPNQASWAAQQGLRPPAQAAVDYILQELEQAPGEITVVAIGPLSNIARCIETEAAIFSHVAELVIMGGSVRKGYGGASRPEVEYNIGCDPAAARRVFQSGGAPPAGIKLTVVPLDATGVLQLPAEHIRALESSDAALAHAVTQLLRLWQSPQHRLPVLHDPLAVATVFDRSIGRFQPMSLEVTGDGLTVARAGVAPNAAVCLEADARRLFDLTIGRIAAREAP
jgi:inosine-uridine nucleoside N-ribohydrolase